MTQLQYIYEHRCPPTCDRIGEQLTMEPPVHHGVVQHVWPVCAEAGTQLWLVDVVRVTSPSLHPVES